MQLIFLVTLRLDKNITLANNFRMDRKMTELDIEAAKKLRAIWERRKRERSFTQETSSEHLGMNQSAVSMYVRGAIPLGVEATLKFAYFLDVDPREIRPDLPEWVIAKSPKTKEEPFVRGFSSLSFPHKQAVLQLVDALRAAEIGNFN